MGPAPTQQGNALPSQSAQQLLSVGTLPGGLRQAAVQAEFREQAITPSTKHLG